MWLHTREPHEEDKSHYLAHAALSSPYPRGAINEQLPNEDFDLEGQPSFPEVGSVTSFDWFFWIKDISLN